MAVFLDSSRLDEIAAFRRMGIIRGVTTNPTILKNDGVVSSRAELLSHLGKLAKLVYPLPVSAEVLSTEPERMLGEAKELASLGENINVKIPIHGPEGELHYVELIHRLETAENIRVNATAMMSAQQCLLAALAGASYVSLFGGRVNNMGYDACGEIARARALLDKQELPARLIVGSVRESLNVTTWLEAGAHIVTVTPPILRSMLVHPYTKETVQMFVADAAKFL